MRIHDAAVDYQAAHAELRKGVMPCRFCGVEWLWEGNRHDPLKMAGVRTMSGASRHLGRALTVAFGPMLYAIADFLVKVNRKIRGSR